MARRVAVGEYLTTDAQLAGADGRQVDRGTVLRALSETRRAQDGAQTCIAETSDGRVIEVPASATRSMGRGHKQ